MTSNDDFTSLPEDLVINILTRLPVKILLRLKSVCKQWYNLIKTPNFIRQHYHNCNNQTDLVIHHCGDVDLSDIPNSVFSTYCNEGIVSHQNFDYLSMKDTVMVAGPVNGLLLLTDEYRLLLWNPATRESRTIPEPNPNFPKHLIRHFNTLGFGLDPITRDYKVISVSHYWDSMQDTLKHFGTDHRLLVPVIGVYSFASDSWNFLDPDLANFPSKVVFDGLSVSLNEYHYWLSSAYGKRREKIFTFDVRNEVFREVHCPSGFTRGVLSLCNDNIALFSRVVKTRTIDAWFMEVEGCWTKKFAIEDLPELFRPLQIWKNNVIFENMSSELVLYDVSTHKTRNTGVSGLLYGKGIFGYKESLASVHQRF